MKDIKDIIKDLQDEKMAKNIQPSIVLMSEIQTRVAQFTLEELRRLVRDKEIKYHQTVNSVAFTVDL